MGDTAREYGNTLSNPYFIMNQSRMCILTLGADQVSKQSWMDPRWPPGGHFDYCGNYVTAGMQIIFSNNFAVLHRESV